MKEIKRRIEVKLVGSGGIDIHTEDGCLITIRKAFRRYHLDVFPPKGRGNEYFVKQGNIIQKVLPFSVCVREKASINMREMDDDPVYREMAEEWMARNKGNPVTEELP